jgi:hypothetical protein
MHIQRVQETIDLLRNSSAGPYEFNYSTYGSQHPCGTVACAAGYMTQHKPFQEQGFYAPAWHRVLYPKFKGERGTGALMSFLEMSEKDVMDTFYNLEYSLGYKTWCLVTAADVANHLQLLLNKELALTKNHTIITLPVFRKELEYV